MKFTNTVAALKVTAFLAAVFVAGCAMAALFSELVRRGWPWWTPLAGAAAMAIGPMFVWAIRDDIRAARKEPRE